MGKVKYLVPTIALLCACARTLPADPATASLYRDLHRLVVLQEATGWRIDRDEVRRLIPEALMSICRTDRPTQARLRAWLDRRIYALGGPVEQAYQLRGKNLGKVAKLLELSRVRMVHDVAVSQAGQDCPFWIERDPGFAGLQIADDRWLLSFGGGGKVIGLLRGDKVDISAGGAGRLAFGRALGDRWALLAGFEFGGSGAFPRSTDEADERGSLVLAFDTVLQPIVRYRMVSAYVELEAGYLMRFTEQDTRIQPGVHVGVALGLRAARKEWWLPGALFPGVAFAAIYERTFPRFGEPTIQMIKLGFRGAFDVHR